MKISDIVELAFIVVLTVIIATMSLNNSYRALNNYNQYTELNDKTSSKGYAYLLSSSLLEEEDIGDILTSLILSGDTQKVSTIYVRIFNEDNELLETQRLNVASLYTMKNQIKLIVNKYGDFYDTHYQGTAGLANVYLDCYI